MTHGLFRTEDEFVKWLQGLMARGRGEGRPEKALRLGIGDDAALVRVKAGHELILTTDMSIEGVHFSRRLHPPEAVGHRALARSLSDVAAMGGVPRYALVSLAMAKGLTRTWVTGFYRGILALARRFGVELVGGDTALVPGGTFVDVLVTGQVRAGRALRRSGASVGDQIYVSGRLGLSALGFGLLQKGVRPATAAARQAIDRHLYPEPQCALGRFLSERRAASALMDLSDGLSTDLRRLCTASGVGARLWAEKIPGPDMLGASESLQLALHGGEDYQLLFTVPPRKAARLPLKPAGCTIHHIGEIEASKELRLITPLGVQALESAGWDHFR